MQLFRSTVWCVVTIRCSEQTYRHTYIRVRRGRTPDCGREPFISTVWCTIDDVLSTNQSVAFRMAMFVVSICSMLTRDTAFKKN